ncbi:4-hydroxy-tetrahydrodipicolinate synthase [Palleronia marisminoris]|uniref:4-hydroxy-tetrahydrodipicolinate synthase n=1 Tax=Palleronia marisminoris TaxID=315423 RepID=A0A1Y5S113_9RHOB|nr:dihydrodipicolinate synthase family protein [Palleronia marisminoris]SFG38885.1 4-hydroxy-tetrahydrodipicolinate synthase [Palleronia marisminoris]SLN29631.1 4-hydroxy-tetrahydrodipicolinate synthase [Palleronia marisminoris]
MPETTQGLHVVAQTPFHPDGAVDHDSIATLSEFYYRHGARGLTVLGVSGEAQTLAPDEAVAVAASFVAASGGRAIFAGVSSPNLAILADVAAQVMAEGARGVMIAPAASARTDEALLSYFDTVFERIGDVPTVLQDFPAASGVQMSVPAMARLVEAFPQIGVVKEEDLPSARKVAALRCALPRHVRILTGNNGLYLPQELARGADGPMAGFSYPEMLSGVDRLMREEGDVAAAHALFNRYLPLLKHEAQGTLGIALRKESMRRRGALASAAMRAPGGRLDEHDIAELDAIVAHMDLPE